MRVHGQQVERAYPPGVLRRGFLALVVSHAAVAAVVAALPLHDDWAEDLGVGERVVGGGLWLFLVIAVPVVVVSFVAWAVIAWYVTDPRHARAGWFLALGIGWLGALPIAGEGGSWEPVVLVAAACGQLGAGVFRRFVTRTRVQDAAVI